LSIYDYNPIELSGLRTYPLASRPSKVTVRDFARPLTEVEARSAIGLIERMPRILAADTLREVAAAVSQPMLDAPVSGGPPASGSGTLTVMAGGDAADIARIAPLMTDVAGRFTHMGAVGSGLAAKMLNQLIVGCIHVVMAEAASMAEAAGIDAARLPECLAGGHADGSLLQRLYPRMVARDFAPQGYARQLRKDLHMVGDYAGQLGTPTPMLDEALALYDRLVEAGHAELDTAAVFKLYDERAI
jgi:3-hydroxyisobutyrate dehydrogenase-like beta-hydroxyacid dehydrogenase